MAPDLERLARRPWPTASLASSGTSFFRSALAPFMFLIGRPGPAEGGGKFRPAVGCAHVDDPDRLQPRPRRLDPEQAGVSPLSTQRQNFFSAVSNRCW